MTPTNEVVPPVVCTLSLGKRTTQVLEWGDLRTQAITSEQIEDGVVSTFPLELADQIEDLAQREMSCCGSWLNIDSERVANTLRLRLTTTNPEGVALILSMSGMPETSATTA